MREVGRALPGHNVAVIGVGLGGGHVPIAAAHRGGMAKTPAGHYQYQVLIKPSPPDLQDLGSLQAIGIDMALHDIRLRR